MSDINNNTVSLLEAEDRIATSYDLTSEIMIELEDVELMLKEINDLLEAEKKNIESYDPTVLNDTDVIRYMNIEEQVNSKDIINKSIL